MGINKVASSTFHITLIINIIVTVKDLRHITSELYGNKKKDYICYN